MTAIGPGDWVECVDDGGPEGTHWEADDLITAGTLYCVSDVFVDAWGKSVLLIGWERKIASEEYGCRVGYGVWRFRPIYRPKTNLIERLMQPVPDEPVKVKA